MLKISNLRASIQDKDILKGINLDIGAGEVHAIMGPNGSGKSTLANVLAGRDSYEVTGGSVTFDGKDLLDMDPEERAWAGVFLGFQYPVEIPGVSNMSMLKSAVNARRKALGQEEATPLELLQKVKTAAATMKVADAMLQRGVNEGFSGGEKKRNEILQMLVLEPRLAILDETDSGLDIDALKVVSDGVNALRAPDHSVILVTHYQRLLDHIKPDFVHVLADGRIVESGGPELALTLEEKGYAWIAEMDDTAV
ncbi:MAG: Fe-S cluster assembly ATPase SufC [Oceanococcus sp.]